MEPAEDATDPRPPVEPETLRAWIALAKRQPKPVFADEGVKRDIKESFTALRGLYDYDEDQPVPVTFRTLEGIVRLAEAAAKFEFFETIEDRHVEIANSLVRQSMEDIGKDEDGNLDADIKETGQSKSQKNRMQQLVETIQDYQSNGDNNKAQVEKVIAELDDEFQNHRLEHDINNLLENGQAVEPQTGFIRYMGTF